MRKILVTGGGGFIGSHIVDRLCAEFPDAEILVLDKMTYAADIRNLLDPIESGQVELVVGDICDFELCSSLIKGCDLVVHAAAESHVDRSFHSSIPFTRSNALGTHCVMEACRTVGVPRIIHVSTDEVYGEVLTGEADENAVLNPTNPYSASKAAAEMIVNGYRHSFKLPVITVRANNIFGIRQFPEKLIPKSILSLIGGDKISLHGDGSNVRHFLSALDFADAIVLLAKQGVIHETYNIGSPDEFTNIQTVTMICDAMGVDAGEKIVFVADRPFNDRRYAISWDKITQLGWTPRRSLKDELAGIVAWYSQRANYLTRRIARGTETI
jgi:UDP-glucose 4,6-dehydratase